jgi:hypothetical protein
LFFVGVFKVNDETAESGSGFISRRDGSADPDPDQNVIDPQHFTAKKKEDNLNERPKKFSAEKVSTKTIKHGEATLDAEF